MNVYLNDRILPLAEARLSPEDRGFLFADGVYEVVLAVDGRLFLWEEHLRRLRYGLAELEIDQPAADLEMVARDLLEANGQSEGRAVVYLQVTRGAASRSHRFPPEGTPPTLYGYAKAAPDIAAQVEKGIGVATAEDVRWARCDIKSIALLANSMAYEHAHREGAKEAVFVRDGLLVEGAHTNVFLVADGALSTPPEGRGMLSGVTRRAVLGLAEDLGIPCRVRAVEQSEVDSAEEIFVSGTTSDLTPVVGWDGRVVGGGAPGPVTRRLQAAYADLIAAHGGSAKDGV